MAGILLCWSYVFFISVGMGALAYPFVFRRRSFFFLILTGLFFQTLLVHAWALFFPVGLYFYIFNVLVAALGYLANWEVIAKFWKYSVKDWKKWKFEVRIICLATILLILFQSTTDTMILDNDGYYIQSIKWLNEFGLVKGLANLHIYLGQMSGWHLLQSSFNFGFLGYPINCLNGFLMMIVSFFSFYHLSQFLKRGYPADLFIGLLPISNLLFFQIISVPSPDLPIFLLTQIIFYVFYKSWNSPNRGLKLLTVLCLFAILIKPTSLPILLFPGGILFQRSFPKRDLRFFIKFSFVCGLLFILKNFFVSGLPLYPIKAFSGLINPDWKVSEEVFNYMFEKSRFVGIAEWEKRPPQDLSEIAFLKTWLFGNGFRSVFNIITLTGLIIIPVFIRKHRDLLWIYAYCLLQFIILYFSSPQVRFIFPITFGFILLFLIWALKKKEQSAFGLIAVTALIPVIFIIIPIKINHTANGVLFKEFTPSFNINYLVMPSPATQTDYDYDQFEDGNLLYHSPTGNKAFLRTTGEGKLPTANNVLIEHFKNNFNIRPQLRTDRLKHGFYAEKIKE